MGKEEKHLVFRSPKNFKRGRYILNRYRPFDLLMIGSAIVIAIISSVLYLDVFSGDNIMINVLIVGILLLPLLIVYLLFLPMPVHLNVLEFIKSFFIFAKKQKKWKWEGIHQFEEESNEDQFEK